MSGAFFVSTLSPSARYAVHRYATLPIASLAFPLHLRWRPFASVAVNGVHSPSALLSVHLWPICLAPRLRVENVACAEALREKLQALAQN